MNKIYSKFRDFHWDLTGKLRTRGSISINDIDFCEAFRSFNNLPSNIQETLINIIG
jgi:hypothetical protein